MSDPFAGKNVVDVVLVSPASSSKGKWVPRESSRGQGGTSGKQSAEDFKVYGTFKADFNISARDGETIHRAMAYAREVPDGAFASSEFLENQKAAEKIAQKLLKSRLKPPSGPFASEYEFYVSPADQETEDFSEITKGTPLDICSFRVYIVFDAGRKLVVPIVIHNYPGVDWYNIIYLGSKAE